MWNLYVWLHGERLLDTFTSLDAAEQVRDKLYEAYNKDMTISIRPIEITNSVERSMNKYKAMRGNY